MYVTSIRCLLILSPKNHTVYVPDLVERPHRCLTIAHLDAPEGSKQRYYYRKRTDGKQQGKEMTPAQKQIFEQKNLTCGKHLSLKGSSISSAIDPILYSPVQYSKLSKLQERDMFQRVQLGMPLKEGEKLQSLWGDWPAFCSELCRKFVENKGGLHEALNWDTSRGVGFQIVATVVRVVQSSNMVASQLTVPLIGLLSCEPEQHYP